MADPTENEIPDRADSDNEPLFFESLLALEFPPPDFKKLEGDYYRLWNQMIINPARIAEIDSYAHRIAQEENRYQSVAAATGVPWYVISLIHCLEGSLNFATHLHNGDPLNARTVHVPHGRPPSGSPPFSWEESAIDALEYDKILGPHEWSVAGIAYLLEGYNGWGYRLFHPDINTPYLWSFSNQYQAGKYVEDTKGATFVASLVSDQCGALVLLKAMAQQEIVALSAIPIS